MKDQPAIIYIGGYGRSGSTLLERILATHSNIVGCGEVQNIKRAIEEGDVCSCGKKAFECEFWSRIITNEEDFKQKVENHFQAVQKFDRFSIIRRKPDTSKYQLIEDLIQNNPDKKYLIDSSKSTNYSTYRALNLSTRFPVKMIHIVRNGIDVLNSNLSGDNMKMQRGDFDTTYKLALIRTSLSWPLANLACHLFKKKHGKDSYLRIRYEDLTDKPEVTLTKIGSFLNLDYTSIIEKILNEDSFPKTHQISGNRMRHKDPLILRPNKIKRDKTKWYHKAFFWTVNFWMMKWYGY